MTATRQRRRGVQLGLTGIVAALMSVLLAPVASSAQQVVPVGAVSNGCGPGFLGGAASGPRLLDTATYLNARINITAQRYTVNFRPACDLHDAGYGGFAVPDNINGGVVDYQRWSKDQVDGKFLNDLRILCRRQIPSVATVALNKCLTSGGPASLGANDYYWLVQQFGGCCFVSDPARRGLQTATQPAPSPTAPPTTRQAPTTTIPRPVGPPTAPTNLAIAVTPSGTRLSWTDNATNETAYFVSDSVNVWRLAADQTTMSLGGVAAGLRVCLTVAASNSTGSSAWAPYACATSQG